MNLCHSIHDLIGLREMQMQSQHFHTDVVGVCSVAVVGVLLLLLVLTLINKTVVICGTERSASVLPVKCNQNAKHAPRRALLHFHLQIARERKKSRERERDLYAESELESAQAAQSGAVNQLLSIW